jgi:hypothetical protein
MVVEFFFGCWIEKTVWEYLALLKKGMGAKGGVTFKKSYLWARPTKDTLLQYIQYF